jgi:hypothetical protein
MKEFLPLCQASRQKRVRRNQWNETTVPVQCMCLKKTRDHHLLPIIRAVSYMYHRHREATCVLPLFYCGTLFLSPTLSTITIINHDKTNTFGSVDAGRTHGRHGLDVQKTLVPLHLCDSAEKVPQVLMCQQTGDALLASSLNRHMHMNERSRHRGIHPHGMTQNKKTYETQPCSAVKANHQEKKLVTATSICIVPYDDI